MGLYSSYNNNRKKKAMIIDTRSEHSVYITIGKWVYYIDDSTGEQIIEKWKLEDEKNCS